MPATDKDLQIAFRAFDTDRSGTLSRQELAAGLAKLVRSRAVGSEVSTDPSSQGQNLTRAEIDELMLCIDADGSGEVWSRFTPFLNLTPVIQVSYEEFVQVMLS